nr:hypothetical protein HAGR004_02620 [Bdellovibrio sp. HAGR004]
MKMFKALAAVSALVVSTNAFAASSGQLLITGTVAETTYLSLTATGTDPLENVDQTLNVDDIVNGAATQLSFANIMHEISNSTAGYKITLSSVNAGELQGPGTSKVKYSLDYNSAKIGISNCALTSSCTASSGALTAKTSSAVSVNVKATSTAAEIAALQSGVYSDTVTVTIEAL